jgi:hypothetical protein
VKDLTITLEDRPGRLADLGEATGKAGVNIEGMCATRWLIRVPRVWGWSIE